MKRVPKKQKEQSMNDREKLFDSLGPILERNRKVQEARDRETEDRPNSPEEYIVDTTIRTSLPDPIPVHRPEYTHATGQDTAARTEPPERDRRFIYGVAVGALGTVVCKHLLDLVSF